MLIAIAEVLITAECMMLAKQQHFGHLAVDQMNGQLYVKAANKIMVFMSKLSFSRQD